ncbi:hypothetical protein BJ508DRAFT_9846 [Ascobolus immersus RN42]|uniref:Transglutaminase-like domain-containing protein n=1 Tax=Ascobolus immersus RN42 TaxID=1160509 RepID=A0A3N4HWY8_ASCIM|nr:hypothetical protein BJ508DRAFT_9846 [Ascobolus immersus RN42]
MPLLRDRDFSKPDQHAARPEFHLDALHKAGTPITKFARQLCKPFDSPIDAYRAIFFWLHLSIKYSVHKRETEYQYQHPETVFGRGRGRCVGFSALFKEMANAAGLPCMVVGGMAENKKWKIGPHAWIMVEVEGWGVRWIDPTWGARGREGRCKGRFFTMEMSEWSASHWLDSVIRTPKTDKTDLNW